MNPFSRVKDPVVIEMMKEIIKKKRKQQKWMNDKKNQKVK